MTLSQTYLAKAKGVAKRNQYTCHMFVWQRGESLALNTYQEVFKPPYPDESGISDEDYWWSDGISDAESICGTTYAQNARVIALLLAHEMTKTGDITL